MVIIKAMFLTKYRITDEASHETISPPMQFCDQAEPPGCSDVLLVADLALLMRHRSDPTIIKCALLSSP